MIHLVAEPGDTELFFDFDGVLAPICDDPAASTAGAGVVEHLEALVATYQRVCVVSGRPVSFLASRVPRGVDLFGLYGLEWMVGGSAGEATEADHWRSVIRDAAAEVASRFGDDVVEDKGLSLTVHYRREPSLSGPLRTWAVATADASGLDAREAKMSWELHPPIDTDKGSVVEQQAGAAAVVYAGDDVGDLPAFRALQRLRNAGRETVAVLARTDETPESLFELADVVVDGAAGVAELLEGLVRRGELID